MKKEKIIERIKAEIKKRNECFIKILEDDPKNKMPLFEMEDVEKKIWALNKMLIEELEKEVSLEKQT